MEKKIIIVNKPVSVAGITLIPVSQISIRFKSAGMGTYYLVIKKPIAVVSVSKVTKKAFGINGEEISLKELVQKAPELTELL